MLEQIGVQECEGGLIRYYYNGNSRILKAELTVRGKVVKGSYLEKIEQEGIERGKLKLRCMLLDSKTGM